MRTVHSHKATASHRLHQSVVLTQLSFIGQCSKSTAHHHTVRALRSDTRLHDENQYIVDLSFERTRVASAVAIRDNIDSICREFDAVVVLSGMFTSQ
jgi:hypothetical protein